jgi:hypothetical protein
MIVTNKNMITDLKITKKLISVTFTEIISSCSFLLDCFLVVFQISSLILNHCFLLLHRNGVVPNDFFVSTISAVFEGIEVWLHEFLIPLY